MSEQLKGTFTRRTLLKGMGVAAAGATVVNQLEPLSASAAVTPAVTPNPDDVVLHWLDGVPTTTTGAAWGVPWPRGAVAASSDFALATASGTQVPIQSWPLAYWPDGTLKWSGHAIGSDVALEQELHLTRQSGPQPSTPVTVSTSSGSIVLSNGTISVTIATSGKVAIPSISRGGRTTASNGRLVLQLQDQPSDGDNPQRTTWTGVVEHADVEQSGPVRAVVKMSGHYLIDQQQPNNGEGNRTLFPWTMRVYLGAGAESARVVHSFVWDGDASKDFVSGLGLTFDVPMSDPLYDRHIRFTSQEGGIWGEPVLGLTGLRREPGLAVDAAQVAGTATPPPSQWSPQVAAGYPNLSVWNDFSLIQDSADHFSVWKRVNASTTWLKDAGSGDRAGGFAYVGGISGGLGVGVRNFWQQYPRAADIRGAGGDTATMTVWFWSPHGDTMDMRPYDTASHGLDLDYEDPRYGWGIATGIARSNEVQLFAFAATPSRDRIAALSATLSRPAQLVAAPEVYASIGIFGRWGLPNRSTSTKATLEDSIETAVSFYRQQVDERKWYGFWDYGDVMHTYDADRHVWRYDVGGYAWDNGELGTDAMLWYQFLRSGRPDTFWLAYEMTRHISETDTFHAGPFVGLGSRHDVLHWGDGAKEPRVSESYTKRFMYYLTADELLGDNIRVSLSAPDTLVKYPPLRDYLAPPAGVPTMIRIGPDWYGLVSNWLTEWERTGDSKWRDLIATGMGDIAQLPAGLFTGQSGGAVGFDPATGHVSNVNLGGDYKGGYNLAMAFCGDQIMWETIDLIDVPAFRDKLLEFARYVQAPSSEQIAHFGFAFNPQVFGVIYSRVTAWAGEQLNDPAIEKRGWQKFLSDPTGTPWPAAVLVGGTSVIEPVHEIPVGDFTTNDVSQRNLAIIELLAIAPDAGP